jgi:hypothetical protein
MNLWKRFKALIPDDPLEIGQVEAIDTLRQTSDVLMLGGGTQTVRGVSVPTGQFAFVRGGAIEGKAPDLGSPIALEV